MNKLELKHLNKNFNGLHAVNNFTAEFEEHKITALVGPNGAGKTTVFNLVNNFIKPTSGEIVYNSKSLIGISSDKIANLGIGRLFQDIRLFGKLSVLENLLVAQRNQTGENPLFAFFKTSKIGKEEVVNTDRSLKCLKTVGLQDKENTLAENLSFGEQKLLAIARLLVANSDVLLLDEPAAGVNPTILGSILKLLRQVAKSGKIVIIIEHNMQVIKRVADSVYFMDHGKIIAQGAPDDVLNNTHVREIYTGV